MAPHFFWGAASSTRHPRAAAKPDDVNESAQSDEDLARRTQFDLDNVYESVQGDEDLARRLQFDLMRELHNEVVEERQQTALAAARWKKDIADENPLVLTPLFPGTYSFAAGVIVSPSGQYF